MNEDLLGTRHHSEPLVNIFPHSLLGNLVQSTRSVPLLAWLSRNNRYKYKANGKQGPSRCSVPLSQLHAQPRYPSYILLGCPERLDKNMMCRVWVKCVCEFMCVHVCMCMCAYICITYVGVCVHICMCIHVPVYVHINSVFEGLTICDDVIEALHLTSGHFSVTDQLNNFE